MGYRYKTLKEAEQLLSKDLRRLDPGNKEIVIACIGTDKCIGDALGPIVGTMLSNKLTVYGTMHEPIHALNIDRKIEEIVTKHPNAFIISIDACLGAKDSIGDIMLREKPIKPGAGIGKSLPSIGDVSIVGIVDTSETAEFFSSRSIRLSFVYDLANTIANSLYKYILERSQINELV